MFYGQTEKMCLRFLQHSAVVGDVPPQLTSAMIKQTDATERHEKRTKTPT
jgi:hypothetical protein